ncbi:hypothetical protein ACHAPU_002791 [Fusarium lateritium]
MSTAIPFDDADSSNVHLLPANLSIPNQPDSSNDPKAKQAFDEDGQLLLGAGTNGPVDESMRGSDNEYQLDDLSEQTRVTGILMRKALPPQTFKACNKKDKSSVNSKARESILWTWKIELLLLLTATGLLAAICLILNRYDEKELPHWDYMGITLNTLISIIATFFRAILALVTFEVLAQLKWNWISQETFRPMQDVQLFDSASRCIIGGLRLLPVITIREPLALGATFVTVLSLGIGSFTQQTIHTYKCQRQVQSHSHPATITVANSVEFSDFGGGDENLGNALHPKIQLAIIDAILSSREYGTLFSCSTGNYTFPTFTNNGGYSKSNRTSHPSLGLCSRCSDIQDLVRGPEPLEADKWPENITAAYSLPGHLGDRNGKRMKIIMWPIMDQQDLVLNARTESDIS